MAAKPTPPDPNTGTVEDWLEFKDLYSGWVEAATDEDLLDEMINLPAEGRPFTESEAWRFHLCELRRRRPSTKQNRSTNRKKEDG